LCKRAITMDGDSGGDLSDGLDEFEASAEERQAKGKGTAQAYANKPYDEAYEISQDLSVAESYDGRDAKVCQLVRERSRRC
jgi:hypothetical protein